MANYHPWQPPGAWRVGSWVYMAALPGKPGTDRMLLMELVELLLLYQRVSGDSQNYMTSPPDPPAK